MEIIVPHVELIILTHSHHKAKKHFYTDVVRSVALQFHFGMWDGEKVRLFFRNI
uniref:Uncharacterized protein n=1 Tax=Ascaris lumbricoides TaxID=6252 RepID=A0A0M3HUC1_ASCLU